VVSGNKTKRQRAAAAGHFTGESRAGSGRQDGRRGIAIGRCLLRGESLSGQTENDEAWRGSGGAGTRRKAQRPGDVPARRKQDNINMHLALAAGSPLSGESLVRALSLGLGGASARR
jgi:hypothetical protein